MSSPHLAQALVGQNAARARGQRGLRLRLIRWRGGAAAFIPAGDIRADGGNGVLRQTQRLPPHPAQHRACGS